MRSVTGGGELKFLDKLSPVLQLDMQTRLQWSKSVQMETLKINIPIIFLILPTANYPQKEGFIYWILQLILDVKSVVFF